jgi:hypothetical protein
VIDAGGRNDYRLLQPTLDAIINRPSTATIGTWHLAPCTLHLDSGYG